MNKKIIIFLLGAFFIFGFAQYSSAGDLPPAGSCGHGYWGHNLDGGNFDGCTTFLAGEDEIQDLFNICNTVDNSIKFAELLTALRWKGRFVNHHTSQVNDALRKMLQVATTAMLNACAQDDSEYDFVCAGTTLDDTSEIQTAVNNIIETCPVDLNDLASINSLMDTLNACNDLNECPLPDGF